jgi:endonuclease YncB( thermonuclease family)
VSHLECESTRAQAIVGHARVLDGDTIEIERTRIRLHGIDAAEAEQRCSTSGGETWDCAGAATERLRGLMANRQATCSVVGRDVYERTLAACRVGDADVQEVLVREGLAWAYRQYSRTNVPAEDAARAERRGIWQTENMPPWEWRRQQPMAVTGTAPSRVASSVCVIKGNINSKGERIYHTPASPWYDRTTVDESRGQRWFCSEAEARAAGWRPARW